MEGSMLLMWGVLFGAVGLGFFTYGRRQRAPIPLLAGVGLVISPYFMPNVPVLLMVGAALVALPYFVRV